MLKFYVSGDNIKTAMIGIGLSEENIKRLKENKPIMFNFFEILPDAVNLDDLLKAKVAIVYGETEEKIAKELGLTP